ncbi:hypothetical protein GCM10007385_24140 [Tateyamaria omphalii]|uniref:hypothetical protein n=1 Tax=Tateyamaria omphalii TaxID=299262 RepID=UPI00198AC595|nr:hypothetical protein [Tateyamaria omphalii]GGX54936.1 hypothetical protein GCM10007385_24140 [Tateyamaria omphalii]
MKIVALSLSVLALTTGVAMADLKAKVAAPWNGKKVPAGQNCALDGGNGSTPPFQVTGIPDGTVWLIVEYNDKSYKPLSRNGGHGTIGYAVNGASGSFPAVPGMSARMPKGVQVIAAAKSTGKYASPGYLPPCSGGRGNSYEAVVKAVDANGKVLDKTRMSLGRY